MPKPRRLNSDIALEFLRRTFGSEGANNNKPDTDQSLPQETDDGYTSEGTLHTCSFLFSKKGWEHLHMIGLAIKTSEPSQIVRRGLATIWLVASDQCELRDKITGNVVKIPE